MRYLLDSHVLFQSVFEVGKLAPKYHRIIASPDVTIYISVVSLWELAIKRSIGKLKMPEGFHEELENSMMIMLPVSIFHIKLVQHMPFHHRDPFDRMLIAQAQVEKLTLLTDDRDIGLYRDIVSLL